MENSEELPSIEEIEASIPDERKKMSFGGPGEDVIDVMDRMEKEDHHHGKHIDDQLETCPFCPDPENKHVSPTVTGRE